MILLYFYLFCSNGGADNWKEVLNDVTCDFLNGVLNFNQWIHVMFDIDEKYTGSLKLISTKYETLCFKILIHTKSSWTSGNILEHILELKLCRKTRNIKGHYKIRLCGDHRHCCISFIGMVIIVMNKNKFRNSCIILQSNKTVMMMLREWLKLVEMEW